MVRRQVLSGAAALGWTALGPAASWAAGAAPGPRNLITDVAGLKVGQAQDPGVRTGVTVILPDQACVVASDVRGGGPATRETDATALENLVHAFDAVVLSGGSVYGLAAADGVVSWLGSQNRGFTFAPTPGVPRSPVVPAAALYDLANGGRKDWGMEPPYRALGVSAAQTAGLHFELGTAGAGYGAMAGGLKGGIGSASVVSAEGIVVGAIVAVNAAGSAIAPGGKTFWAAPYEIGNEYGGLGSAGLKAAPGDWGRVKDKPEARKNTTIALVATDAVLTPDQCKRVAMMAQDGLALAIRPVHTPFDGDVVFAMATGRTALSDPAPVATAKIGSLAADTLARAIARAIFEATPWPGAKVPTWRSL